MIQPTSNTTGFFRSDALSNSPSQKTPVQKDQAKSGDTDTLSSASTEVLRQALSQSSDVRPNMVQRGKALAVDPTYPPREIINALAKLMLQSRDPSASA